MSPEKAETEKQPSEALQPEVLQEAQTGAVSVETLPSSPDAPLDSEIAPGFIEAHYIAPRANRIASPEKEAERKAAGPERHAEFDRRSGERAANSLNKRPRRVLERYESNLIAALLMFILGNAVACLHPQTSLLSTALIVPALIVCLGLFTASSKAVVMRGTLWLATFLIGALFYQHFHFQPKADDVATFAPLAEARISGMVLSRKENQVVLLVNRVNRRTASGKVLVYEPKATPQKAPVGSNALVDGNLKEPFSNTVPGNFNQREYLRTQGITAIVRNVSDIHENALARPNRAGEFLGLMDAFRQRVSDTFTAVLPSPHAQVLGGIVLGDRAIPVDKETKRQFVQTGLVHILAASGMNVGIIAGFLFWMMGTFRLPFRARMIIAMIGVAFYALLTGLPPSIQRAAAMLEIALLMKLINRELSPLFLLTVAATMLVLINPDNIASIGFQFSILTTFGLITMMPPLQERLGYYITHWLATLILVPVVAQLWITPLSVAYFNDLPVHSVPLNILAIALIGPLTTIGFIAGLAGLIWQPVGEAVTWLAWPFVQGLLWVVQFGDQMAWAKWRFASPPDWLIALLYAELMLSLAVFYPLKNWNRKRRIAVLVAPIMLALLVAGFDKALNGGKTKVDVLPLSYRQSAFLIHPAGSAQQLLLTPASLTFWEGRTIAGYLKHNNIGTLTGVYLVPTSANGDEDADSSGLRTALKNIDVKASFLAYRQTSVRQAPDVLPDAKAVYPNQSLKLGNLELFNGSSIGISTPEGCLLALSREYQADTKCAIQAVSKDDLRLYASEPLKANQFYRLQTRMDKDGAKLEVY